MTCSPCFSARKCIRLVILDQLQRTIIGFPHLLADPFLEVRLVGGDVLLLGKIFLDCLLNNVLCDLDTDLPHVGDVREQPRSSAVDDGGFGS